MRCAVTGACMRTLSRRQPTTRPHVALNMALSGCMCPFDMCTDVSMKDLLKEGRAERPRMRAPRRLVTGKSLLRVVRARPHRKCVTRRVRRNLGFGRLGFTLNRQSTDALRDQTRLARELRESERSGDSSDPAGATGAADHEALSNGTVDEPRSVLVVDDIRICTPIPHTLISN